MSCRSPLSERYKAENNQDCVISPGKTRIIIKKSRIKRVSISYEERDFRGYLQLVEHRIERVSDTSHHRGYIWDYISRSWKCAFSLEQFLIRLISIIETRGLSVTYFNFSRASYPSVVVLDSASRTWINIDINIKVLHELVSIEENKENSPAELSPLFTLYIPDQGFTSTRS